VTEITEEKVMEMYGGEVSSEIKMKSNSSTNAYFLMYRLKNEENKKSFDFQNINENIKNIIEKENEGLN
jgi:hypothetical protein